MIKPGSKVICIEDRFPVEVLMWGNQLPVKGCIYTVIQVKIVPDGITRIPGPGLVLEELHNPNDLSFSTWRFKELPPDDESYEAEENEDEPVFAECC